MARPRIDPALAVKQWESGMNVQEIAEAQGVSRGTVSKHLRSAGVDTKSRLGQQKQKRAPHGKPGRWMRGCRCEVCLPAMQEYKRQDRAKRIAQADLDTRDHPSRMAYDLGCRCAPCVAHVRDELRERQEKTLATARKTGKPWTGEEVEYAIREDLSIHEIAKTLGRTYAAVSNVRRAVADPKAEGHHRYMTLLGRDYWHP